MDKFYLTIFLIVVLQSCDSLSSSSAEKEDVVVSDKIGWFGFSQLPKQHAQRPAGHSQGQGQGQDDDIAAEKKRLELEEGKQDAIEFEQFLDDFKFANAPPVGEIPQEIEQPATASDTHDSVCDNIVTKNGQVRGRQYRSPTRTRMCSFTGIPFAVPPIGDLRFKAPVPIENWEGIFNATNPANSCIQVPSELFPGFSGETMWNPTTEVSENCLFLNIWVPANILQAVIKGRQAPVAVMLWIHGGGMISGTSSLPIYDGSILSGNNNVVFASINYRLGALASLWFGSEYQSEFSGNVHLKDQVLGMQWIYNNALSFGGDPDRITLVGESAGGISVSYHLLSEFAAPWFKRAIIMSGTAPAFYRTPAQTIEFSYGIATGVGCYNASENPPKTVREILQCLRNTDAMTFATFPYNYQGYLDAPAAITLDGVYLTDTPQNLLRAQNSWKRADIIIGNVADEGSYFLPYWIPQYFTNDTAVNIDYDKFRDIMRIIFGDLPPLYENLVTSRYTNWQNVDDYAENLRRVISAAGDRYFTCMDVNFAKLWAARGQRVHFYYFTQRSSSNPWGQWMGVMHGYELDYLFGTFLANNSSPGSDKLLSTHMMRLFANFAKNGNPSENWEYYTAAYPVYLDLNATALSDQTTSNIFGPHADICNFWNYELPLIFEQCSQNGNVKKIAQNKSKSSSGIPMFHRLNLKGHQSQL